LKDALTTIKPNQSPHAIVWQIQSALKFFEHVDETGRPREKTTELLEHKHFQINLHVFNHLNS
jgi:hypothetical protein